MLALALGSGGCCRTPVLDGDDGDDVGIAVVDVDDEHPAPRAQHEAVFVPTAFERRSSGVRMGPPQATECASSWL